MPDQRLDSLIDYARRFIGAPYVYGGNGPHVFDCSGLACTILKKSGNLRVSEDLKAFQIYDRLAEKGVILGLDPNKDFDPQKNKERMAFPVGTWFFYGAGLDHITHVSFMVDAYSVLEAGGGDSTTDSVEKARKIGACVREVFIDHRKDRVAAVFPKYGWVK